MREGISMSVYRITLYVDGHAVDVALPGDVPVETLMPELHDTLRGRGVGWPTDLPRQLVSPGRGVLNPELPLSENGIRDGAVLTLFSPDVSWGSPAVIDAAATVAALRADAWWTRPMLARRTGLTVATAMAGLTGLLLVPGGPGLPNLLLAAAATSVAAVVSARVAGDPSGAASAAACCALLCTAAALAATLCGRSITDAGVLLAAASVLLMTVAARVAVRVYGLSPALTGDHEEHRVQQATAARNLMNGLVGAGAAGSGLGVLAAGSTEPSWSRCAFAVVLAAVLLIRLRAHPEPLVPVTLVASGTVCYATALVTLHQQWPASTWLVCVLAVSAGAGAAWLGLRPPDTLSPGSARLRSGVEHTLLVAVAPLACWSLGAFDTAGGWL